MMEWLERKRERMKKIVEVNNRICREVRRLIEDERIWSAGGEVPQNIIDMDRAATWNYNMSVEHLRGIEAQIEYLKGANQ